MGVTTKAEKVLSKLDGPPGGDEKDWLGLGVDPAGVEEEAREGGGYAPR